MSLTRRDWFLHRVAPMAAVFASAGAARPAFASNGPRVKAKIDRTLPVHPYLQYGAENEPNRKVSVIVQKKRGAKGAGKSQEIARAGGGTFQEEFEFLNSFLMEIPQKAVIALGRNPNVAQITPNTKINYSSYSATNLRTTHLQTVGIPSIWNGTPITTGQGVTVAVLDSGITNNHADLSSGITSILVNPRATGRRDQNGHGTHVIGTIKGIDSQGRYYGVAPGANVVSIQVADDTGLSMESDVIRGLQWVATNASAHNIKVINLSVSGALPVSYRTSPLCAAVEVLWNRGIVVVVAAGNRGNVANAVHYGPGNDPYVITVGALDHNGTTSTADDSLATFSSRGLTLDGHAKPEIVAPGRRIVAPLSGPNATLARSFPERVVDSNYIRLSGTSMAAPVVAGVVALILQQYPSLTPNQVKWLLTNTMKAYPGQVGSAGVVDPVAALTRAAQGNLGVANQGLIPNGNIAEAMNTGGVNAYWESAYWESAYWESAYWESAYWESAYWESAYWESSYEMFLDD